MGNFPVLMFFLCCANAVSLFAGYRNESHLRKEWSGQRKIEKQTSISEKQQHAFKHLLHRMFDCMLQLGPNLEIVEPCPNLAAMLFLTNAQALQGSRFCDYIASREDQDSFVATLGKDISEDEPAGILPLHLRDTQSREVQVHVYYTSFHDQDDSLHHIIGIVEAGEREGVANPVERPTNSVSRTTTRNSLASSSESGDDRSESEITLQSVANSNLGEVSLTFGDTEGLTVISCTPGFTTLCGPIGDSPQLIDWIVDKDRFIGVVQIYVNSFCSAQDFDLGQVRLRTPSATSAGIEYLINECTVDAIRFAHGDEPSDGRYTVQIGFRNIQRRSCKRRKRQAVHPSGLKTSLMQKSVVL